MDDKQTPTQNAAKDEAPDAAVEAIRAMMQGTEAGPRVQTSDPTRQGATPQSELPEVTQDVTPKNTPETTSEAAPVVAPEAAIEALLSQEVTQDPAASPASSATADRAQADRRTEPSVQRPKRIHKIARKIARETGGALLLLARFTGQLLRHPTTPRVVAVAVIFAVAFLFPTYALILALIATITAVIVYFSMGPERIDAFVARRFDRLRARDPKRAETLRRRAIRVVAVMNKVIDRLPERWTSGLYLPVFEDSTEQPEKMQADPFERLEGESKTVVMSARKPDPLARPSAREPRAAGMANRYRRL